MTQYTSDNPYQNTQLLLDGQQRLTSISAVIRGEPVNVRGRKKPLELLFNLEHPGPFTLQLDRTRRSKIPTNYAAVCLRRGRKC